MENVVIKLFRSGVSFSCRTRAGCIRNKKYFEVNDDEDVPDNWSLDDCCLPAGPAPPGPCGGDDCGDSGEGSQVLSS